MTPAERLRFRVRRLNYRRKRGFGLRSSHMLVTGTGRAGTTLLMRIMTRLGLDTGYGIPDLDHVQQEIGRAGLERHLDPATAHLLPEIIKNPGLGPELNQGLSDGWLKIDLALIPVRALSDAAESRRQVSLRAQQSGHDALQAPGGLWNTTDADRQEEVLAVQFASLVETLVRHGVPITFLSFPKFATNADYLVKCIGPLFQRRFGVSPSRLRAAHALESRPSLIGTWQ